MNQNLVDLGWRPRHTQEWLSLEMEDALPARVLDVHRTLIHIHGPELDKSVPVPLKLDDGPVTVGDWVLLDGDGLHIIARLERSSLFKRRAPGSNRSEQIIAANVDTLFIVSSCNQDFNEARLERFLSIGKDAGCLCLVVLTKEDETENAREYVQRASQLSPGVMVESVNALETESLEKLRPWIAPGQTIALLGSSGVGKSTISNTLLGSNRISTGGIREDDARGRHTTSARSMYQLPNKAWIIDTPGLREIQLLDVQDGIDDVFAEISALSAECRFANCTHETEPGCAISAALEEGIIDAGRLKRWQKLSREEAYNRESLAERRSRDKATGKFYKSIISETNKRKGR